MLNVLCCKKLSLCRRHDNCRPRWMPMVLLYHACHSCMFYWNHFILLSLKLSLLILLSSMVFVPDYRPRPFTCPPRPHQNNFLIPGAFHFVSCRRNGTDRQSRRRSGNAVRLSSVLTLYTFIVCNAMHGITFSIVPSVVRAWATMRLLVMLMTAIAVTIIQQRWQRSFITHNTGCSLLDFRNLMLSEKLG